MLVINSTCYSVMMLRRYIAPSPDEHNFPTDHHTVEFCIHTKFKRTKPVRRVVFDFNKTNFPALCRGLSEAHLDITTTNNIDECWEQWKDAFLSVVESFVPTKLVKDNNSPPWIDGEVRHLIRKKYTALRHSARRLHAR